MDKWISGGEGYWCPSMQIIMVDPTMHFKQNYCSLPATAHLPAKYQFKCRRQVERRQNERRQESQQERRR